MRAGGGGPYFSAGTGSTWLHALYVRDALGLPFSPELPRLAVEVATIEPAGAVTEGEWLGWLEAIEQAASTSTTAKVGPRSGALKAAYEQTKEGVHALDWERDVGPRGHEWASSLLAAALGAEGLVYAIAWIPVAGIWHHDVSDRVLLISLETWLSDAQLRAILEPRLRRRLGL